MVNGKFKNQFPIRFNFEMLDTEQYSVNNHSRCRISKKKNVSDDDMLNEINSLYKKFGIPFEVKKVKMVGFK